MANGADEDIRTPLTLLNSTFNIHNFTIPHRDRLKVMSFEMAKSADEGVRTPLTQLNSTFNIHNSTFAVRRKAILAAWSSVSAIRPSGRRVARPLLHPSARRVVCRA
jgi:hypothetical protein